MPDADDRSLLRRLAAGDRDALGHLVTRHAAFVYATARRRVGDAHLAEDVTQAVFLILTSKAARLQNVILVGWLYRTVGFVAANAMKKQRRQEHYERRAATERSETLMPSESPDPETIRQLEDAITSLRSKSRDALLLRFFRRQSLADVGVALGISEEAAKKRVSRAVDELRAKLSRSSSTTSAASTIAMLSAIPTAPAPATLTASILHPTSAATSLAKGALFLMTAKQASIVAGVVAALLIGTGTIVVIKKLERSDASTPNPSSELATKFGGPMLGAPGNSPPIMADLTEPGNLGVTLPFGTVEVLGSGDPAKADGWVSAVGGAIQRPWDEFGGSLSAEAGRAPHAFAFRTTWTDPANQPTISATIDNSRSSVMGTTRVKASTGAEPPRAMVVNLPDGQTSATIRFHLATGEWKPVITFKSSAAETTTADDGESKLEPLAASGTGTEAKFILGPTHGDDVRIVMIDGKGTEHPASQTSMESIAGQPPRNKTTAISETIKPSDVVSIRIDARPFDRSIEFADLPLTAAVKTTPRVNVGP